MGNVLWGICPVYVTPEVYPLPAYLLLRPLTRVDWTRTGANTFFHLRTGTRRV